MKRKFLLFGLTILFSYGIGCAQQKSTGYGGVSESDKNKEANKESYFGHEAGLNNTGSNTFVGYKSGRNNVSGNFNTFSGYYTGHSNTFIGARSGRSNNTGSYNTFLRSYSIVVNDSIVGNNAFLGYQIRCQSTTGSFNTFIGYRRGHSNQTGSGNVFLGANVGHNETSSDLLYIDNSSNSSPLIWGNFANDLLNFSGNVGIGTATLDSGDGLEIVKTSELEGYKLYTEGGILTEKVKIAIESTDELSNYVFEEDYLLKPLEEVEAFTTKNKHLPGIPSTEEVVEEEFNVEKMDAILLLKIEELTRYINKKHDINISGSISEDILMIGENNITALEKSPPDQVRVINYGTTANNRSRPKTNTREKVINSYKGKINAYAAHKEEHDFKKINANNKVPIGLMEKSITEIIAENGAERSAVFLAKVVEGLDNRNKAQQQTITIQQGFIETLQHLVKTQQREIEALKNMIYGNVKSESVDATVTEVVDLYEDNQDMFFADKADLYILFFKNEQPLSPISSKIQGFEQLESLSSVPNKKREPGEIPYDNSTAYSYLHAYFRKEDY